MYYANYKFYTGLLFVTTLLINQINSDSNKEADYNDYQQSDTNELFRGLQLQETRDQIQAASEQQGQMMPKPNDNVKMKADLLALPSNYSALPNWPIISETLGNISGVSFDADNNIAIFHRGDHIWDTNTFNLSNFYQHIKGGPIRQNCVLVFNRITGKLIREWGKNLFYMPHGLHIDKDNNAWITDVALHQVMKFNLNKSTEKPELILGKQFTPGNTLDTFCKPTAAVSLPSGEFFVSDGYCNFRIIKYSNTGIRLKSWGENSFSGRSYAVAPENYFAIPHALTLALDLNLLCVADRENGRVQCFDINNGTFHSQYHNPIIGSRIFSVAYAPIAGGRLFVVNGPEYLGKSDLYLEVKGFIIDMPTKQVISKFGPTPNNSNFSNPHDIIVTPDGSEIYVVDLNPNRAYKLMKNSLIVPDPIIEVADVKPTATIDNNALNVTMSTISNLKTQPGATALLIVTLFVFLGILLFGLAVVITKKRKRGCFLFGSRNRRHAWDFPTVKTDGTFKLGNLLDRKRVGFEKLDTDASDEEQTNMLSSSNA